MDIRNWSMDQIMQLPDHCFGRRWIVSCVAEALGGVSGWDIAELALPERCVIWELVVGLVETSTVALMWRLALGDQLPTAVAMMDAMEPVFHGMGDQGPSPRYNYFFTYHGWNFVKPRLPIEAKGRRLVLEVRSTGVGTVTAFVGVVVSSIPTEVRDCYI